jgi:hypothetical protein
MNFSGISFNIKPKCQIKWEEQYGGNIDWTQIWTKLKKIKVTNKVKEFQWKYLHNINNLFERDGAYATFPEVAIISPLQLTTPVQKCGANKFPVYFISPQFTICHFTCARDVVDYRP